MNNNFYAVNDHENAFAGALGALLFSLAGCVLWFVLYQIGFLAAISGFIGVICAIKGYMLFAKIKDESKKCIIISTVTTTLVLIAAWYFCVAYEVYVAHLAGFEAGEIDYTYTFPQALAITPMFFAQTGFLISCLMDLFTGLIAAGAGIVYYLARREKKIKAEAASAAAEERAKALHAEDEKETE